MADLFIRSRERRGSIITMGNDRQGPPISAREMKNAAKLGVYFFLFLTAWKLWLTICRTAPERYPGNRRS